jgi:hypothetical protein
MLIATVVTSIAVTYTVRRIQVNERGERDRLVELKYRCPFKLSDRNSGKYYYQGDRCVPFSSVPVEYYLQCQLQMLATGLHRCDLVSYSPKGGSLVYALSRDDALCKLVLLLLQEVYSALAKFDRPPRVLEGVRRPPLNHPQYIAFLRMLARSVNSCSSVAIGSRFNPNRSCPFLDEDNLEGGHILEELRGALLQYPVLSQTAINRCSQT